MRAASWVGDKGRVWWAKVSGRAEVEERWKVVVLRARRWTSRWIWRQVRRVRRCEGRSRRGALCEGDLMLSLSLLLSLLLDRLAVVVVGLLCGGCWRGSSWRPIARGDSIDGTVGIGSFTGRTKTSA